jgi:anti-sigma-K factor RskA
VTVKHEMTCEEFKDLAPAYALGVLDESERIACAHHLVEGAPHRGCVSLLEEARWTTARLSAAVPAQIPPERLWQTISSRLASVPHPAIERRRRLRPALRALRGTWAVHAR